MSVTAEAKARVPATDFSWKGEDAGHLFLSDASYSQDLEWLKRNNIKAIVNLAITDGINNTFEDDELSYWSLDLHDADEERNNLRLFYHLQDAIRFIDGFIDKGESVLVHCMEGKSRSATVVVAYWMYKTESTLRAAFDTIKKGRESIRPNNGFVRQLIALEKVLGYGIGSMNAAEYPPPLVCVPSSSEDSFMEVAEGTVK